MKISKKTSKKRVAQYYRKKHIRKVITGTENIPRLSVFRSIKNIYIQAINDEIGITMFALNSLSKKNIPLENKQQCDVSYMIGKTFGELLVKNGIKKASFDRNGLKYTGRIAKLADGIRSSGLYI